ncbi:hypothetical protein FisN_4Lh493 [Fistulifera solaris]|uniref:Uncharacterized protein n=1 Tax=Fistulifera solaris TaxID=1519565 RepID=A0A1Z5KEJ7_FISSO|nr:hypothetical protein FisN_4Lh493 [Fistulifera solaris]|eukprot:GAX24368.1 hypothetical protein FisN_4Lh493 [Fistulifera solaris]
MKTGGFSRFARKPEPKETAGGISGVGGKSDPMTGQPVSTHSDGENVAWGSSDFGSGFGFDSGLDEMSFGGEIQNDAFPVPKPIEKKGNFQNSLFLGAPRALKSPPPAKNDDSSATPTEIAFPQQTAGGTIPSMFSRQDHTDLSIRDNHVDFPSVITPAPSTKRPESVSEPYTLANASNGVAGANEELQISFVGKSDAAHVNPRRVTLGGIETFSNGESPGTMSLTRNIPHSDVIEEGSAKLTALPRKLDSTTTSDLQSNHFSTLNPTGSSKEEPGELLNKTMGDGSTDGVAVEENTSDSAEPSFEELFQSIMSNNLQFEDRWKTFEEKILDLSAELSMKHGNILEIEQSALHLKQEIGLKFQALLSQVTL